MRLLLLADDEAARHAGPVRTVAARAGVRISDLVAPAGRALERFAFLVARTDFAATYLALGNRVDPSRSSHLADLRDIWSETEPPRPAEPGKPSRGPAR